MKNRASSANANRKKLLVVVGKKLVVVPVSCNSNTNVPMLIK